MNILTRQQILERDNHCCQRCGSAENLVVHHVSYIPEVVETLCKRCDAKERRHPPQGRGLHILKSYPHRSILLVPKRMLEDLGEFVEIYPSSAIPLAVVFSKGMPFPIVISSLQNIISDIYTRIGQDERNKEQARQELEDELIINSTKV